MNSLSLLASSNYIILNKDLIRILGLHEAVLIGELCSEYLYWESTNQLVDDEYFYATREKLEEKTCINARFQRIAMNNLVAKGILTIKRRGIPCQLYYKINENAIIECLQMAKNPVVHEVKYKDDTLYATSNLLNEDQDNDKMNLNNNNINNKINNNNIHTQAKTLPEEQKKQFAKLVTMTEQEYQDLIKDYGETTTDQLIEQLNLYKQAHGKSYESDYAAIKIWVTKRVQEMKAEEEKLKQKQKNNNVNNQKNYNQREYPPDFFDSLYANNKWR